MTAHCPPDHFGRTDATGFWLSASAAATAALFAAALALFEPFWRTNDDLGMSMIAHGYGSAASPSANLLFQNVLIGELLQVLPTINGVLPYSWLAMLLMFLSGWALLYFVARSSGAFWLAVIGLAIVYAEIISAPQFTITAGIATAAGVLALLSHIKYPSVGSLVVGALLIVIGYLTRAQEALFVLLVALPFVSWRELPMGRAQIITVALVLAFLGFAEVIDYRYYQGPEWAVFNTLDPLRLPFTDFSYAEYILKRPARMHALGFSKNDIRLIEDWFFVDPAVADPVRLRALVADWLNQSRLIENISLVGTSLAGLFSSMIAPVLISAIALTGISRCREKAAISWALFLLATIAFALLGRPAVVRTYYPIAVLLLFANLQCGLRPEVRIPMVRVVPWTVLLVMLAAAFRITYADNQSMIETSRVVREDLAKLDHRQQYIVWGAVFPYELAFPLLAADTQSSDFPQYGLGWESLTPFALENFKGTGWRNLVDRLDRDREIPFIATPYDIGLLATYCREHRHKTLTSREMRLKSFSVFYVSCRDG